MLTKISTLVVFFAIMILNMLFRPAFPQILQSPINCGVIAMLGGFIIVPVVSWITPHAEKEKVNRMFDCCGVEVSDFAKNSR